MTDGPGDRVTELLEAAERGVDSLAPLEDASEGDVYHSLSESNDLLSSAEDARAVITTVESRELLEAIGLAELPDGREAETIPEALALGESERVADLQVFLKLARVADAEHDGGDLEGALEDLRDAVDRRGTDAPRGDDDRTDADSEGERTGDESDRTDEEAERIGDRDDASDDGQPIEEADGRTNDETRADDADSKAEGDSEGDLEEELRSTVSDALEGFGEDVRDVRDRLEEVTADEGGETADEDGKAADEGGETADEGGGTTESADEDDRTERAEGGTGEGDGASDEPEPSDDNEDDESILEDAFDSDDTSSGPATMYSTMAPPPSERADMRTTRYSTMPSR